MSVLLPALVALTSAAFWGFNAHLQRLGLDDTDPLTGALISVGSGTLLCWLAAPFLVDPAWWSSPTLWLFAAIGLIVPALGQTFQIASVGQVGAALTASIGSFAPVFSIAIGLTLFDEDMSIMSILGLVLMMAGLLFATWSPRGIKRGWPLWAILLPLAAAAARGVTQPAVKFGMVTLPSPFFAILIMSSVSTLALGLIVFVQWRRGRVHINSKGIMWFFANGAVNTSGLFLLHIALQLGAITVVSPLAATTPLWALFFGVVLFRREVLGRKHLIIALLVVAGGALVVSF